VLRRLTVIAAILLLVVVSGAMLQADDPPYVDPAVQVTARPGSTGIKADQIPNSIGWDHVPWGDSSAVKNQPLQMAVFSRTLIPPTGLEFIQYPVGHQWFDSIPADGRRLPVYAFGIPNAKSIAVVQVFMNTEIPDADNFPWRLEGNLGGDTMAEKLTGQPS
jgi:hypothetical protein